MSLLEPNLRYRLPPVFRLKTFYAITGNGSGIF